MAAGAPSWVRPLAFLPSDSSLDLAPIDPSSSTAAKVGSANASSCLDLAYPDSYFPSDYPSIELETTAASFTVLVAYRVPASFLEEEIHLGPCRLAVRAFADLGIAGVGSRLASLVHHHPASSFVVDIASIVAAFNFTSRPVPMTH